VVRNREAKLGLLPQAWTSHVTVVWLSELYPGYQGNQWRLDILSIVATHFILYVVKVKVKATFRGLLGAETFVQAYCTLAPRKFLPSPLEALCISQTHSALY
jgi:hypothetical protein